MIIPIAPEIIVVKYFVYKNYHLPLIHHAHILPLILFSNFYMINKIEL